jgi:hypothetical protein
MAIFLNRVGSHPASSWRQQITLSRYFAAASRSQRVQIYRRQIRKTVTRADNDLRFSSPILPLQLSA